MGWPCSSSRTISGVVRKLRIASPSCSMAGIVELGTTEAVLRTPSHSYTRMLIASVPSLRPRSPRVVSNSQNGAFCSRVSKTYAPTGLFGWREPVVHSKMPSCRSAAGRCLASSENPDSGKSTLARCLVRLIDPTGDRYVSAIARLRVHTAKPCAANGRRVQIVFQDPYRFATHPPHGRPIDRECPPQFRRFRGGGLGADARI